MASSGGGEMGLRQLLRGGLEPEIHPIVMLMGGTTSIDHTKCLFTGGQFWHNLGMKTDAWRSVIGTSQEF